MYPIFGIIACVAAVAAKAAMCLAAGWTIMRSATCSLGRRCPTWAMAA
jgi:hypothetical protein